MVLNLICHYIRGPPTLCAGDNKIVRARKASRASEARHMSQPVRVERVNIGDHFFLVADVGNVSNTLNEGVFIMPDRWNNRAWWISAQNCDDSLLIVRTVLFNLKSLPFYFCLCQFQTSLKCSLKKYIHNLTVMQTHQMIDMLSNQEMTSILTQY